ncbi:hypothetical protein [Sphingobacterium deserti]|uniref:Lipoprotein n=1 Tax=Sphingobacterium deserti TaxID=1229276 RepID=A0A0B8T078_9SPHI|nr:hypothetical protein [Sphingobacterium deserti]KGE13581.1 hypothetical protein DI53_2642 [Sphingobacterium deserti]
MKKVYSYAAVVAVISSITIGCGNQSGSETKKDSKDSAGAELGQFVNTDTENPSVYFYLGNTQETDTSVMYTAKSLYESDTVGLQIEVSKNIQAGVGADGNPDEKDGFKKGVIKFSSLGKQSDAFVQSLGKVYGKPADGKMVTTAITPLVFSSNKQAVDLSKNGTYSFKLFMENKVGAEAEVFAILDLYRRLFELKARDTTQFDRVLSSFKDE